MKTFSALVVAIFVGCSSSNTGRLISYGTLKLADNEFFQLKGNSFSFDSLILGDGSVLLLDKHRQKTMMRVRHLSFAYSTINGVGRTGDGGIGGSQGTGGSLNGFSGMPGSNLELYVNSISGTGKLTIDLHGGDGGSGTSETTPRAYRDQPRITTSTQTIQAWDGNGGNGGNILLAYSKKSQALIDEKVLIVNHGGFAAGASVHEKNPEALKRGTQAENGKVQLVVLK